MNRIWAFVKPYRKWSVFAIFFMLGEVTLDILQPILMVRIIDTGIANMDMNYVFVTCLTMVGVALLGVVGGVGNCYFSTKAGYYFARDLRGALYRKIQSFSFANIDRFKTGSLVTRTTNDVTQIQNAFQSIIRMLVRSPFLFIGGVIAVFSIDRQLSLVVAAAIPVLGGLIWFIMRRAFPLFRVMQEKMDRVNVVMQENLAGVRVIKAFGRAAYEETRFGDANDDLTNTGKRAMKMMAMSFPLINLVMNACMIAVFWFGGNMVLRGTLLTGQIMAFVNYIAQIVMSLTMSSFMLLFVSRAKVSVDRVNEVLSTRPDIEDAEHSDAAVTDGRVEFRDVCFRYPRQAGDAVLNRISFTAEPGTTTAILGATGSGKTSLVSLIPRLYDATGGAVLVDGRDVRDYSLLNLRKAIGVVLQESILFSGTVSENLRWGDVEAPEEKVFEAAEIAQADEFIRNSAEGYETMLGQRGVNFSGGQKQRMSIARALVKRPKILIMDDSTSAVDLSTEAVIQKRLREALGEMTVFIIAQRVSSVMDADRIIVMDDGRISDIGTHAELKERSPIYREIVISQLGQEAV